MTSPGLLGKRPTVSVVIPTYNRGNTIQLALQSVLDQSVHFDELLVVDDCSEDNTLEVVSKIKDARIRVVKTPRRSGAPAARNLGTTLAKCEWIAFQDSDDYWFSHKLERQLECIRKFPGVILCYCGLVQYYDGKVTLVTGNEEVKPEERMYSALLEQNFISTQTIIAQKSALEAVGGFREDMPRLQDWELVLRLASQGTICCVPEPLVIAYQTPGSLTSDTAKGVLARLKIIEIHEVNLRQRPDVLSHHYHVIGKQLLATNQNTASFGYFWKAIRTKPLRPRSWFWMLVAATKSAVWVFTGG